jgi:catechol 2,3-dioxygenase-like lactoylglutathione lyase family enzyme
LEVFGMSLKIRLIGSLALVCAFSAIASAQPPAPESGIIGIAHIAFRVSDLDQEIAFLGKLGYQESFAMNSGKSIAEVFVKINDRQFIELYPRTDPSQPLGWMHVCYEVGDLNVLHDFYGSMGLKLQPVRKAGAGNLISAVDDPEGRVTEFTQYVEGSKHMLDKGQHLGPSRVSTQLIGFDLPVRDGAAEKEFYTDLGFEPQDAGSSVRFTAPGAPELRIALRPAQAGSPPEFLFPVPDARKAAGQLKDAGVNATRNDKLVFVHDPDGNMFIFLEAGV